MIIPLESLRKRHESISILGPLPLQLCQRDRGVAVAYVNGKYYDSNRGIIAAGEKANIYNNLLLDANRKYKWSVGPETTRPLQPRQPGSTPGHFATYSIYDLET